MKSFNLLPQNTIATMKHILQKFEQGIPLLCDELHFLAKHEKQLSHSGFDSVIKYYLNYFREHPQQNLSFSLPVDHWSHDSLHLIQESVHTLLKDNLCHIELQMSLSEFSKFKLINYKDIHFSNAHTLFSGMSLPTRSPPYFLYMRWGKLFGVIQLNYTNNSQELECDVLVCFENMAQRNLYQCIADYTNAHQDDLKLLEQNNLELKNKSPLILNPLPRPGFSKSSVEDGDLR